MFGSRKKSATTAVETAASTDVDTGRSPGLIVTALVDRAQRL